MPHYLIRSMRQAPEGWEFDVLIWREPHLMYLPRAVWLALTQQGSISPGELIRIIIEFALEHESRGARRPRFSVQDLANYHPDFEREIRRQARILASKNP